MQWLREMFCEMDWKQFIPSLIATIIGIFGPFWIQSRIEKSKQRKDALDKVEQLKNELEGVLTTIKELEDDEKRYIDPVKTPIWTGLQNTNESTLLSVLRKKPKAKKKSYLETTQSNSADEYNKVVLQQSNAEVQQPNVADNNVDPNDNWYKAVYALYGRIEEYNKWWNLYSTQRAAGREVKALHNEKKCIAEVKEKLCSKMLTKEGRDEKNKDGIPYLLELLDVVITVNTSLMRRVWNKLLSIFSIKTNRRKKR